LPTMANYELTTQVRGSMTLTMVRSICYPMAKTMDIPPSESESRLWTLGGQSSLSSSLPKAEGVLVCVRCGVVQCVMWWHAWVGLCGVRCIGRASANPRALPPGTREAICGGLRLGAPPRQGPGPYRRVFPGGCASSACACVCMVVWSGHGGTAPRASVFG